MKKFLLLAVIVLGAISAYPQNGVYPGPWMGYNCAGFDGPAQCPVFMPYFYRRDPLYWQSLVVSGNCFTANHCYQVSSAGTDSDRATFLQTQITAAANDCANHGALVLVPAGFGYGAASYFNLPPTNCDAIHWVQIASDHMALLPPQGTRVSSNANMPTLYSVAAESAPGSAFPVIEAVDNPTTPLAAVGGACTAVGGGGSTVPCGWFLSGLEVTQITDTSMELSLLVIGDYCQNIGLGQPYCPITSGMTAKNLTSRFAIDRCYIHPNSDTPAFGTRHAVSSAGSYVSIMDSVIHAALFQPGTDVQGFYSTFGFGPYDIGNSDVEAPTENIFFGGTDPIITGTIPSDIYIHQNYLHKNPAWVVAGSQWLPKDVLESKNSQRLLAEGNILGPSYDFGLNYVSFQLSPRNALGHGPWQAANDTIFRYNLSQNVTGWFAVLGANNSPCQNVDPSVGCNTVPGDYVNVGSMPTVRASVHDNIAESVTGPMIKLSTGSHSAVSAVCPIQPATQDCYVHDISIVHNTLSSIINQPPVPIGGPLTQMALNFSEAPATTPQQDAGYNLTIRDNILPCSDQGSGGCLVNDALLSTSANCTQPTQTCGFALALNAYFTTAHGPVGSFGWIYTGNVIPNVTAEGWVASDIPVMNSDGSTANNFAGSLPATFNNVGFVNWNSGIGGDYHLCYATNIPTAACSGTSTYQDMASDGWGTTTEEGKDPGANVDAVKQWIANVPTGVYTIQPIRTYGPVKGGEKGQLRTWTKFPGYYDIGVADGSGKFDYSQPLSAGALQQVAAGINPMHDLQHDPGQLINLSGANVGILDHDYIATTTNCGFGAVTDSKASWGQEFLLSANNVRSIYMYQGPFVSTSSALPVAPFLGPGNVGWHYKWTSARPGFVNTRFSVDNNCGGDLTFSQFDWRSSNSVYTFDKIPNAAQYPPNMGLGWEDGAWLPVHCGRDSTSYDPGTAMPWLFQTGTVSPVGGWFMDSIAGGVGGVTDNSWVGGSTPGYTMRNCSPVQIASLSRTSNVVTATLSGNLAVPGGNGVGTITIAGGGINTVAPEPGAFDGTFVVQTGSGTSTLTWNQSGANATLGFDPATVYSITTSASDPTHYPITSDFLHVLTDGPFSVNPYSSGYRAAFAGGGQRSEYGTFATTIHPTGTDALIYHACSWIGDLGIRQASGTTGATELANECSNPAAPTMTSGTLASYNHDYGCWDITADGTPKIDITLTHQWTSPILCIHNWNGATPTVAINGVTQIQNVNYVASTNDGSGDPVSSTASGLLVQPLGLPTNGLGGLLALPVGTRIVISAGALSTNGTNVSPGANVAPNARIGPLSFNMGGWWKPSPLSPLLALPRKSEHAGSAAGNLP